MKEITDSLIAKIRESVNMNFRDEAEASLMAKAICHAMDIAFEKNVFFADAHEESRQYILDATNSYAWLAPYEIPLLCVKDTDFFSLGNGFLLTSKGVHASSAPAFFPYSTIGAVGLAKKDLVIAGQKLSLSMLSDKDTIKFRALLEVLIKLLKHETRADSYMSMASSAYSAGKVYESHEIEEYLQHLRKRDTRYKFPSNVYFTGDSSDANEKIKKCRGSNNNILLLRNEMPLLLLDNRRFWRGGDICLATTRGIYANSFFPWTSSLTLEVSEGKKDAYMLSILDGEQNIQINTSMTFNDTTAFCDMLTEIRNDFVDKDSAYTPARSTLDDREKDTKAGNGQQKKLPSETPKDVARTVQLSQARASEQQQATTAIEVNSASLDDFLVLPGVSFEAAQEIVRKRTELHDFSTKEEFMDLLPPLGIQPHLYKQIENMVEVRQNIGNNERFIDF